MYVLMLSILHEYMIVKKNIFKTCLGNNIRKRRYELGLTVEQLALNTGLSYSQVSRIELGKISTSAYTIYMLSKSLNISVSVLFDLTEK